jgi:hypothetical protein
MTRIAVLSGIFCAFVIGLSACKPASEQAPPQDLAEKDLFRSVPASESGITFSNDLTYTADFNVYTYRNFYNGGGVGLGDLNNDGLQDVFFCGNMLASRIYLNKGNFQFEDITATAGIHTEGLWVTGVSVVDINADGWLDIYLCKAGKPGGERRYNELFVNNHDGTFTEKAAEYGLNDTGFSTHAAFFDFDRDGDLDCYLLNNSIRPIGGFDLKKDLRNTPDPLGGNKFYRNDNGKFTDITEKAGIYSSIIGFGLGVTVGDVNRDGWPDVYVSNDFFERDYLYINNHDGTFTEALEAQITELSAASMGADMADINNDGYPEIFVTDMLPQGDARMKTKTTFEDWNKYTLNLEAGYYHQFTRNVLQLNRGPQPFAAGRGMNYGPVFFSEIGRMAGVYGTDWSWGALMQDLNLDGLKDIFVANGIYQDLTDQDFINYMADPRIQKAVLTRDSLDFRALIDAIPIEAVPNYAFSNNGNLTFTNKAALWGLGMPSHSNGSAYGDLDNDGDLDLVVNNVNSPAFVYQNQTRERFKDRHYLRFQLEGEGKNTFAVGAQITAFAQGQSYYLEHLPMRGFQSSVDTRPLLGLGNLTEVDSVTIRWPNGTYTVTGAVKTDTTLVFSQSEGKVRNESAAPAAETLLAELTGEKGPDFRHVENAFNDFARDRLMYHMVSSDGPKMAVADVNGDGLEDVYFCGAKDSPGMLMLQQPNGTFAADQEALFLSQKTSEETDALFFDANGDKAPDLYIACGGNELPNSSTALADRLYMNDGKGKFTLTGQTLPAGKFESSSCVRANDFDGDGDQDLFVGIRIQPFLYGIPQSGYLLQNDGKGNFSNASATWAPELEKLGLITDMAWTDLDGDGKKDMVIVGEWMPVTVFYHKGKSFERAKNPTLAGLTGFWNTVKAQDLDGDGDDDLLLGNHGLNSRFKATPGKPVSMAVNDFDQNGMPEQIISVYNGEKPYPLALRHDLVMQLPSLKKKYLKYESYKEQTLEDIFLPEQLENAIRLEASVLESGMLINEGKNTFRWKPLPQEAQFAPIFAFHLKDLNGDGQKDIFLAGNFFRAKPEVGSYNGSFGLVLAAKGKGEYVVMKPQESGFFVRGEVRQIVPVRVGGEELLVLAMNNGQARVFGLKQKEQ